MLNISENDIAARIARDNPWWQGRQGALPEADYPRRIYFQMFCSLALSFKVRRAAILLGPRRVGKTVILKQLVQSAIDSGVEPRNILYASIDTPVYAGMRLEKFLDFLNDRSQEQKIVMFDEVQYLRDWEIHLKDLVDSYPNIKFIATGSAAAALRLKSKESGAGRFSEFILPPLTFHEFLVFCGRDSDLIRIKDNAPNTYTCLDIEELNKEFINYLNFGGYPEAVLNEEVRKNADQFVKNDIIDKVLLKDLPNLYGIKDIQELNKLFSFLAYNAGSEASLENIAQRSGLTKPTIKKYIEYLESAFLIIRLSTYSEKKSRLTPSRERHFKVYLNNPSMRAALFAPVEPEQSDQIGHLAEAAIFSQWQHSSNFSNLRYARWRNAGEIDVVFLSGASDKPLWVGEIKWSDRVGRSFMTVTSNLSTFIKKNKTTQDAFLTSKTLSSRAEIEGVPLKIIPSALYCYTVGRNITRRLTNNGGGEFHSTLENHHDIEDVFD